MKVFNYSRFSLQPKDEAEKALFWEFRASEMGTSLRFTTGLMTVVWTI